MQRHIRQSHTVIAFLWVVSAFLLVGTTHAQEPTATPNTLNFFDLMLMGRYWMLPILLMSLVVGTFAFERLIGLRGSRVLPRRLATKLKKMTGPQAEFEVAEAFRICEAYPSAAANVIKAMLVKVGRPQAEVEQTVQEATQREATRMYGNVRWLNLAAAVTPLMGLLGTVWGMIRAFHDTTQLTPDQNKADHLAEGIYIALVTTLGGLLVAIPAAIMAHYFEGRIQKSVVRIEELLLDLMPQVEAFEGRVRYRQQGEDQLTEERMQDVQPPPIQSQPTHEWTGS